MSHTYEIKGLKSFKGHEGEPCAQGSLYRDGKKVCSWSDDDWGGPMRIAFSSPTEEQTFLPFARAYLTGRLDVLDHPYDMSTMNDCRIVNEAVERMSQVATEDAELRKLCKDKLVFKVKNAQEGGEPTLRSLNHMYTDTEVARLKADYPALIEIINARFGTPLTEGSPEHLAAETVFYRKDCKTKTLFIRNINGVHTVFVSKNLYSADVAKRLKLKYPDLVRIINATC